MAICIYALAYVCVSVYLSACAFLSVLSKASLKKNVSLILWHEWTNARNSCRMGRDEEWKEKKTQQVCEVTGWLAEWMNEWMHSSPSHWNVHTNVRNAHTHVCEYLLLFWYTIQDIKLRIRTVGCLKSHYSILMFLLLLSLLLLHCCCCCTECTPAT